MKKILIALAIVLSLSACSRRINIESAKLESINHYKEDSCEYIFRLKETRVVDGFDAFLDFITWYWDNDMLHLYDIQNKYEIGDILVFTIQDGTEIKSEKP